MTYLDYAAQITQSLATLPTAQSIDQKLFISQALKTAYFYWVGQPPLSATKLDVSLPDDDEKVVALINQDSEKAKDFEKYLQAATQALLITYVTSQVAALKDELELAEDQTEETAYTKQLDELIAWERKYVYQLSPVQAPTLG